MGLCLMRSTYIPREPFSCLLFGVTFDDVEACAKTLALTLPFFSPASKKEKFMCVSVDAVKNISHPWLTELPDVEPTDMGGGE